MWVTILVVAIPLGWVTNRMRQQRGAIEALERASCSVHSIPLNPLAYLIYHYYPRLRVPRWVGYYLAWGRFPIATDVVAVHSTLNDEDLGSVGQLPDLQELRLNTTNITDAGLSHVRGLAGLKLLDLNGTPITDAGMTCLSDLHQLYYLDLSNTQITDVGLVNLNGMSNLRILLLRNTHITDAGLVNLENLNIKGLELDGSQVTATGISHIKQLPLLEGLTINGAGIKDAELEHLRELKQLRVLKLNGRQFTDATLVHFRPLTQLSAMSFHGTNVNFPAVAELRKALPRCFMTNPD